jgi:hypothetical protein
MPAPPCYTTAAATGLRAASGDEAEAAWGDGGDGQPPTTLTSPRTPEGDWPPPYTPALRCSTWVRRTSFAFSARV